jgi:transposase
MEACGSAHYWARELVAMGHQVVLMPPAYIKPYVKRGKNDAVDAAAVCEAMSRPGMRFVPIKSADQQAVLMLHKTRELLIKQRTMSVNALRGHLAEFGLIAPKGIGQVSQLLELVNADAALPEEVKDAVKLLAVHLEGLDRSIDVAEKTIAAASAASRTSQLLDLIPGVGPLIASAIAASVPDPGVFKSGRDFAAWLGGVARRRGSAGVARVDATAELDRRQGEARRHHQAGQPIPAKDAGGRVHLGAARRRQTQRRSRRLDRGVASEKAGAPGRGGARQQAGENLLGDHDHWRSLPPGDLRQGVESLSSAPQEFGERNET